MARICFFIVQEREGPSCQDLGLQGKLCPQPTSLTSPGAGDKLVQAPAARGGTAGDGAGNRDVQATEPRVWGDGLPHEG